MLHSCYFILFELGAFSGCNRVFINMSRLYTAQKTGLTGLYDTFQLKTLSTQTCHFELQLKTLILSVILSCFSFFTVDFVSNSQLFFFFFFFAL